LRFAWPAAVERYRRRAFQHDQARAACWHSGLQ